MQDARLEHALGGGLGHEDQEGILTDADVCSRGDAASGAAEDIDGDGHAERGAESQIRIFSDDIERLACARAMGSDTDDAEGYAKYFIEEGCYGVSKQVVSSACLTKALASLDPPVAIHTSRVRKLLGNLGFEPVDGFIKWNGAAHRVWVTGGQVTGGQVTGEVTCTNPDQIRRLLAATVADASLDFLN